MQRGVGGESRGKRAEKKGEAESGVKKGVVLGNLSVAHPRTVHGRDLAADGSSLTTSRIPSPDR